MTPSVSDSTTGAIRPEQNILRRMRRSDARSNGSIKKAAFMPGESGKDRDGLSVSLAIPEFAELHRARFENEGRRACFLSVELVRMIDPPRVLRSLDVISSPDEDDPAHALIVGIPDRTLGRNELAQAEYYAQ